MRVIAGTARSVPLQTPEGDETRPTTDRIKETLFNILQMEIPGCRFLDLYAGSGQMAIEALSRGAHHAVLIDSGKEPAEVIKANLNKTKLSDKATLIQRQIPSALYQAKSEGPYDIIFMDPPYSLHDEGTVLSEIDKCGLLKKDGTIIIETSKDRDLSFIDESIYEVTRIKTYKTNQHVFIKNK
ncbi:MAG: 16S rRNA (guanine(966)-N(2))-methyltransferase RsmD [Lachnospiraceae bacterium]|uniref:16S rRNA (Guanine(966)-N(2))-methyltransferase RsmD n=1 Tax=Candidatus Weimeria bifida TaxID=2599074 RepID=A0A6N7J124_9FIRM|nr:16S rRNA (guanine(966)-N(2))-methyltransferase RsmD [Candidatus Weimeria bifida]RRF96968.1 MAG: 16S rRNA (guanine(966)-N(2))-methyltransferase RsmD [Lachnospiraceae bacterium]